MPNITHVTPTLPHKPPAIALCLPFNPISHQHSDTISPLLYFTFSRHWEEDWGKQMKIDKEIWCKGGKRLWEIMERVWQERIFNCPFLFLQLKCIMTLKSDRESTCLQSQPYLCNVIQNYRVRMKVGLSSRKKKMTCSPSSVSACLPLTFMLPLWELGTAVQEWWTWWPTASKLIFIFRNQWYRPAPQPVIL